MVWSWTHLVVGIVLIIAALLGLIGPAKQTKIWAMVARVCYVIIIISGIVMFARPWKENPVLLIVKIVVALAFIGTLEMGFAKKTRGEASLKVLWIPLVLGIIVVVLGFTLTKGFPVTTL